MRAAVAEDQALLDALAADGVIETASVEALDFEAAGSGSVDVVERADDGTPVRRLSLS